MAEQKLLRLGILELNNSAVTATMCFDYNNNVCLYHSGYDPKYRWLSVTSDRDIRPQNLLVPQSPFNLRSSLSTSNIECLGKARTRDINFDYFNASAPLGPGFLGISSASSCHYKERAAFGSA